MAFNLILRLGKLILFCLFFCKIRCSRSLDVVSTASTKGTLNTNSRLYPIADLWFIFLNTIETYLTLFFLNSILFRVVFFFAILLI